jgi:hypothetical protein
VSSPDLCNWFVAPKNLTENNFVGHSCRLAYCYYALDV